MKPVFQVPQAPAASFQTGKEASFSESLGRQLQASLLLPSIQSPSVPTSADIGPQSLFYQTITINAREKYPVQLKGNFLYVEGITWKTDNPTLSDSYWGGLQMRTDTLQTPVLLTEAYREIRFPTAYNFVEFSNLSAYPVNVTLWAGFGQIRRDRNNVQNFTSSTMVNIPLVPSVVSKDHFLNPNYALSFIASTSKNVQTARIKSATLSKLYNFNVQDWDVSLWLFAKQPPTPVFNAPFNYNTNTLVGYESNVLAKLDFKNPVTGDPTLSNSTTSFLPNLDIPVFADNTIDYLGQTNFTLWAYLVTNKNYNFNGFELWTACLSLEFA